MTIFVRANAIISDMDYADVFSWRGWKIHMRQMRVLFAKGRDIGTALKALRRVCDYYDN